MPDTDNPDGLLFYILRKHKIDASNLFSVQVIHRTAGDVALLHRRPGIRLKLRLFFNIFSIHTFCIQIPELLFVRTGSLFLY